jgi:hypothetical protein
VRDAQQRLLQFGRRIAGIMGVGSRGDLRP